MDHHQQSYLMVLNSSPTHKRSTILFVDKEHKKKSFILRASLSHLIYGPEKVSV